MGYLSCKTQQSVLVSNSTTKENNNNKNKDNDSKKKKKKKMKEFTYRDLEAATNGFSQHKLLGKGSHGLVYKALLPTGRHVAVKKPTQLSQPNINITNNEVDNEIDILSNIHNPRLVNLVGFTNEPTTPDTQRLLVFEFMSNGTLYQLLHSSDPLTVPPNWGRRIRLALQTAKAVDALHSCTPPVIHRDIKSANVLIDRNFNARLGDFGLALRYGCHLPSTPPAGTMGYLDPLYVTPDSLSTKTDVFSFGILLLEIISGRKAIDVNYSPPSIVDWAIPLIRKGKLSGIYDPRIELPKDPLVRKNLAVIAAKCVRSCNERRPSMKDVVECLSGISKLIPQHSWNGFTNPCMMVDTIGKPVSEPKPPIRTINNRKGKEEKKEEEILDGGKFGMTSVLTSSRRRIYSDLGIRNNVLDSMMVGAFKGMEFRGEAQKSATGRSLRFRTAECETVLSSHKGAGQRFADTSSRPLLQPNVP